MGIMSSLSHRVSKLEGIWGHRKLTAEEVARLQPGQVIEYYLKTYGPKLEDFSDATLDELDEALEALQRSLSDDKGVAK
jgi:hypothetical protein